MKGFLNPITLEANLFLKTIQKYGAQYQTIDEELLNTMDKLVDAINKFCDQSLKKVEETDNLKLIRAKDTECVMRTYQCSRCNKHFGNSAEKAALHISTAHQPKSKKKRTADLSNGPILPKKARFLLTKRFSRFLKEPAAAKLKQDPAYGLIEIDLLSILQRLYPDKKCKTYKFGSRISGIGNLESDLDIFVDIDGSFHDFNIIPTDQILDFITKVSSALKKDKKWTNIITIQHARVPIIRLRHVLTKIDCDIGFSNSLGYCNTMLMRYYFDLQPIAARMCIFLKSWLERTGLPGTVSTYSFTLMVIYYLQMCSVLPSVENLQEDLEEKEFIGPWLSNFKMKSLEELNLQPLEITQVSLHYHLYNFFLFYAEFDFKQLMICPYKGKMVKVEDISKELPKRFKDFDKSNKDQIDLKFDKAMVVQDPLELCHNVTKGISSTLLKYIITCFLESAQILISDESEKPKNEPLAEANIVETPNSE